MYKYNTYFTDPVCATIDISPRRDGYNNYNNIILQYTFNKLALNVGTVIL